MEITNKKYEEILKVDAIHSIKNFKWKNFFIDMRGVFEVKTRKVKAHTFLALSKQLNKTQQIEEAIQVLSEGIEKYPENIEMRKEIAYIYTNEKNWQKVSEHLKFVVKELNADLNASDYARLGESLRIQEKIEEAESYLSIGQSLFQNNKEILIEMAEVKMAQKNWEDAINIWQKIVNMYSSETPANVFLLLGIAHRRMKSFEASDEALLQGVKIYPTHIKLNREYAQSAILQKNWKKAISRLQVILERFKGKTHLKSMLDLGILNEIIGNTEEAKKYYDYCYIEKTDEMLLLYPAGYRKITIFDNGESRIEYYKKLKKVETLCVTFDSINIVWSRTPFGYDFLKKQDLDIVAVRRRKSTSYQQDLSYEDFYEAVNKITEKYKRTVSYGFSLGAYSALYYGAGISNQVLAISPRNSAHPLYGIKKKRSSGFQHTITQKFNPEVSPVIVYDPKNIIDSTYIEKDLLKSYPNSNLVQIPYVGHNTANYLSQIGVLKKFILSVLNDEELPELVRGQRIKSRLYLTSLGRFCLKRNKLNWALKLADYTLEMNPEDVEAELLKSKVLAKLDVQLG